MRRTFLSAAAIALMIPCARAQEVDQVIRVVYVAGENVYVAAGREQGIFPGDTLTVLTVDGDVERMLVLSSMSDRSVLQYVDEGFELDVGSTFRVVSGNLDDLDRRTDERLVSIREPAEESLIEESLEPAESEYIETRGPASVSGRLVLGLNSLRSSTRSVLVSDARTSRTYLTPNAMLSLDAEGLPFDLGFRVRMRPEYRYASGGRSASPTVSLRTYDFYVTRDLEEMSVQIGRFANPFVPTSGYWDGIQLLSGDSEFGYGASFGFLPVRANEQVSFDMPKAAVFARFNRSGEAISNRLDVFLLEIHPTNELHTRRAAGLSHRLNWGQANTHSRLEVDRDPQSGRWVITRLSGRVSSSITASIDVHARYDVSQPYSIYRSFDVISYRRDRLNAGIGYRARSFAAYGDFIWNFAYDDDRRRLDGRSVNGSISLNRIRGFGIATSGSYWWSEFGASMFGLMSLSRSIGSLDTRLYYQISGSSRFDTNLTTHSVAAQVTLPLSARTRSTSRVRFQTGEYIRSAAFETSISVRL